MNKFSRIRRVLLLALTLTLLASGSAQAQEFALPEESSCFSAELAAQALSLFGSDAQSVRDAFSAYGLTVVQEMRYDKEPTDASHTCAYTAGQKPVTYQGEERTLLVIAVRGTTAGEWYSNFDFAPSQSSQTQFAENFLMAAQEIYLNLQPILAQVQSPLVLVTGHSRGAACANLLSLFLNAACGTQNVFVYTSASPTTVRGEMAKSECPNVFNLINPADLVTRLPLSGWGYTRLGQDVLLPGDEALSASLEESTQALCALSPDIASYYTARHSLTGPGESENGLTVYQLMQFAAQALSGLGEENELPEIAEDSDLAGLAQTLSRLAGDGEYAMQLFQQHMPSLYVQLLSELGTVSKREG